MTIFLTLSLHFDSPGNIKINIFQGENIVMFMLPVVWFGAGLLPALGHLSLSHYLPIKGYQLGPGKTALNTVVGPLPSHKPDTVNRDPTWVAAHRANVQISCTLFTG